MPSKDALQRLLDGLQTLFREHLALARLEIKDDVKSMGRDLLAGAAGVPALAAGYLLLMIALSFLLAVWMPNWAAFGIVALVNLGAGGGVTFVGIRKAMRKRVGLSKTGEELRADKQWLASLRPGTRPVEGDGKVVAAPGPTGVRGPVAPSQNLAGPAQQRGGAAAAVQAGSTTPPNGAASVH